MGGANSLRVKLASAAQPIELKESCIDVSVRCSYVEGSPMLKGTPQSVVLSLLAL